MNINPRKHDNCSIKSSNFSERRDVPKGEWHVCPFLYYASALEGIRDANAKWLRQFDLKCQDKRGNTKE